MSVVIFNNSDHLSSPLLPPPIVEEGAEGGAGAEREQQQQQQQESGLEASSSTSSLDSSRRSLNTGVGPGDRRTEVKERMFSGRGVVVELSNSRASSKKMEKSLSHYSIGDSVDDGSEEEEEEEEAEEDVLSLHSQQQLIVNEATESYANSTLPRPYNPVIDSVVCRDDRSRSKWEEAALYIQEGEDDAKFYQHPSNKYSKLAYDVVHHTLYHILHLVVTVLLMLLAFAETPAVGQGFLDDNPDEKRTLITIHGVLEILFLSLLGLDLTLKAIWFGSSHFFKHRRTMLITIILVVMYIEALTVLIRQQNHIRITRVLRPIFFIDTYYMGGVRRVLRQLFKSVKPIMDVLLLLIFFMLLFSLIGYLIFSESDPDYFDSYAMSFISLFITHSTANNPDVMMESYAEKPATPIFFMIYIVITLYFASNVLLAVVYSSFSEADKKKFRKLFCHKRDASSRAFHILGFDPNSDVYKIQFHDFVQFMSYYKPRIPEWQVMCMFKALHKNPQEQYQGLSLDEFNHFYEVIDYKWSELDHNGEKVRWFSRFPKKIRRPIQAIHTMVTNRIYKFSIGIVVFINLIFLVAYTSRIEDSAERFEKLHRVLPVSFVFLGLYIVDILLNILGQGPRYFRKFWNLADFTMVLVSLICLCLETNSNYIYLAFIRPVKLIRLIRLKRRYRDLMNTMVALTPRLLSVFFLICIIYYAFSIIGMEFLYDKVHQGCCNTSWYGASLYYSARVEPPGSLNDTDTPYVFYLNNFDNILRSYVTLFILMVVNNWYIIMEGFASEVDPHYRWIARLYFLMFYIIMLVVVQVVISFMVEAFVTKIQATQRRRNTVKQCKFHPNSFDCNCKQEKKKTIVISLVEEDIAKLKYEVMYLRERQKMERLTLNTLVKTFRRTNLSKFDHRVRVDFEGRRDHTKEDVHMLMYKDEFKSWIKAYERQQAHEMRAQVNKRPIKDIAKEAGMNVMDIFLD